MGKGKCYVELIWIEPVLRAERYEWLSFGEERIKDSFQRMAEDVGDFSLGRAQSGYDADVRQESNDRSDHELVHRYERLQRAENVDMWGVHG